MDERRAYVDLLAEEFRSLATGVHLAARHTYTALQWGTAIVGIIVGAAISQWEKEDAVVELVFLVGVPVLVAAGMLFWVGELAGIRRIHEFMCVVEAKAELALRHPTAQPDTHERWFDSFEHEWVSRRADSLHRGLGTIAVWFACELVVDMNHWAGSRSHLAWPRRRFRQLIGGLLEMSEWQPEVARPGKTTSVR